MENPSSDLRRQALISLLNTVHIGPKSIKLTMQTEPFDFLALTSDHFIISTPFSIKRRGVETKLVIGGKLQDEPDIELIKLIAKARSWWIELRDGKIESQKDLATREKLDRGDVSRILKLAFLAPDIVRAILAGEQPIDLTANTLMRQASKLPHDWSRQKTLLGFA